MDDITLGEAVAYLKTYWMAYVPWVVIMGLLGYTYISGRKHKNVVTKVTAMERRKWFRNLRLKLWYKPRGFVMNRKRKLEREKLSRDLISLRQLMVVEMAWADGEITHAEYKKYVDELAFRFSNPKLFLKGRLTMVKKAIKDKRKSLNEPMTLKEAGFPSSISAPDRKDEGETGLKLTLKAA